MVKLKEEKEIQNFFGARFNKEYTYHLCGWLYVEPMSSFVLGFLEDKHNIGISLLQSIY